MGFWICKTSIYTLVSNYHVFLEWVGIRLFNNYLVGAWLSTGHLDRHDIPDMVMSRYLILNHDQTEVQHEQGSQHLVKWEIDFIEKV